VRVKQALERLDVGQDNTLKVLTDLENYFLTTDYDLLRVSGSLEDREKAEILKRLYITNSDPKQIGSERLKRLLDERIRKLESDRIENLVGEKSKINSLVNLGSLLKQITSS